MRDSGQHLLGVVNTLLDISQIEAGTFPLDPEPVDLRETVTAVAEMLRLKAEAGSVAMVVRFGPDLPQIVADRRACRQILLNLLSNAVKFTPAGGRVSVDVRRHRDGVEIAVADTGIGVPAEDLPRLGEPFFQVRAGHDRPYEGTGLGLSVVRGLVALHGGAVAFEKPGRRGAARRRASLRARRAGPADRPGRRPGRRPEDHTDRRRQSRRGGRRGHRLPVTGRAEPSDPADGECPQALASASTPSPIPSPLDQTVKKSA